MSREATLYDALEVSPSASPRVIKAAYRSLVQCHHPDKHGGALEADARLARINRAYTVLADPQQRQRYDQTLPVQPHLGERRGNGAAPLRTSGRGGAASERAFVFRAFT